jgi:hypothetical protein
MTTDAANEDEDLSDEELSDDDVVMEDVKTVVKVRQPPRPLVKNMKLIKRFEKKFDDPVEREQELARQAVIIADRLGALAQDMLEHEAKMAAAKKEAMETSKRLKRLKAFELAKRRTVYKDLQEVKQYNKICVQLGLLPNPKPPQLPNNNDVDTLGVKKRKDAPALEQQPSAKRARTQPTKTVATTNAAVPESVLSKSTSIWKLIHAKVDKQEQQDYCAAQVLCSERLIALGQAADQLEKTPDDNALLTQVCALRMEIEKDKSYLGRFCKRCLVMWSNCTCGVQPLAPLPRR